MKNISKVGAWSCCWVAALAVGVQGAEFVLKPIRASGSYSVVGNEIRLNGSPQRVFLELQMKNWGTVPPPPDPNGLRTFQAKLEAAGYSSGNTGVLAPAIRTCSANNSTGNAECVAAFAVGAKCNVPNSPGFRCTAGFLDKTRPNYVFFNKVGQGDVDISNINYRYFGSLDPGDPAFDSPPGNSYYGGDLIVDVPAGAMGTFTIGFKEDFNDSFMADENSPPNLIEPQVFTAGKITILCTSGTDCTDFNECTTDVCNANGTCSNSNNYNPTTHCCNFTNGQTTLRADANNCTDDICVTQCSGSPPNTNCTGTGQGTCPSGQTCNGTGQVSHPNSAALTACGSGANSQCNRPDSCDGAGNCNPRVEPDGTACGSNTNTTCNPADTCRAGLCNDNLDLRPNGFACGSNSDTNCDNPDTCNGLGECQTRNEAPGFLCSNGAACIVNERCESSPNPPFSVCGGGDPRVCDDFLTCTDNLCEEPTGCRFPQIADTCLIAGVCYAPDDWRPAIGQTPGNSCEECDPSEDPIGWTMRADGSTCDDGNACTGTGRVGIGNDTCTANECTGVEDPQCNDECSFAIPAFPGLNTSDNSSAGPDDGEASCQPNSNHDVWWEYEAACDGETFISTSGSDQAPSNDTVLSVHSNCPELGGTQLACDDDSGVGLQSALVFGTEAGETYLIRVAGFDENKGPLVLNLRPVDDCLIFNPNLNPPRHECWREDDVNPANSCQSCIPDLSATQWSMRAEGSTCGDPLDTDCDSPDACDGAGTCEPNWKPDGIQCTEEATGCTEVLCPICTKNLCASGVCTHPPEPAGLACGDQNDDDCDNPNTCTGGGGCANNIEGAGHACASQNDDQCDNPNICDGVRSQADGGCLDNFETNGMDCNDQDLCTGDDICLNGACVGTPAILPPVVVKLGSRTLQVTPQTPSFADAPIYLRVTSPTWPCLHDYISEDGRLVVLISRGYLFPFEWGTIILQDPDIFPNSTYHIEAECGVYRSAPGIATTNKWGDLDGDTDIDAIDVIYVVDAFKGYAYANVQTADVHPCIPNGIVNALDVVVEVDAFKGLAYYCSPPCH